MSFETSHSRLVSDLYVFSKVAEHGSFTRAAAAMDVGKSQVTKHINRLESTLGVTLVQRSTRKMSLTDAGLELSGHAQKIVLSVNESLLLAERYRGTPVGRLRVGSSTSYGRSILSKYLPDFLARYPDVTIDLQVKEAFSDLIEDRLDLVIRITDEPPELLAGRPLHTINFVLCGSPIYLEGKSIKAPDDIRALPCFSFDSLDSRSARVWKFTKDELSIHVEASGPVLVNSSDVVHQLILNRAGVGLLPRYVVAEDLRVGRLIELLPEWRVEGSLGRQVWALWRPQRALSPRLRVLVDFLFEVLGEEGSEPRYANTRS